MKTICLYHSRDLDGWMSGAIVKKWFEGINDYPDNVGKGTLTLEGWDYGDEIPDLSEYDKVIMCDISFPLEEMAKLGVRLESNFIWIDHHVSAIKEMTDEYPELWCSRGIQSVHFAACELTWKHFFPNTEMPEMVRLLGRYDCFGHKGTEEEEKVLKFQYGARTVISNVEEAYDHLIKGDDKSVANIGILGNGVYKYLCMDARSNYAKSIPVEFKTEGSTLAHTFLAVNGVRLNPVNFGIDYHKDGYDGFAAFHMLPDGRWSFSLYNDNKQVDCSEIAKMYGGGGHKGAAGFICDTKTLMSILKKD